MEIEHISMSIGYITPNSIVQQVVDRYPQTVIVLARQGLQCAGCYIAPFHTIDDCAREHDVDVQPLLDDLNRAIAAEPS